MGFKIVEGPNIKPIWCTVDGASTYYHGQLVVCAVGSGNSTAPLVGDVLPLSVPSGIADVAYKNVIYGIVIGDNNAVPTSNSTGQYAGGTCVTQAAQLARDWRLTGGDPAPKVLVSRIVPNTVIEGPVYNSTYLTACTVATDSAGSATGYTSAGTTSTCGFTPVANLGTIYCRTGANVGIYRKSLDASATAPQVTMAFPQDVAVGDTFVRVPFAIGMSYMYIAGPGLFVDQSGTPATNYFITYVDSMDLSVSGRETVRFMFAAEHFSPVRA